MRKVFIIGAMILSTFGITGCYPQSPGSQRINSEVKNALKVCKSVTIEHKVKPSLPDEVIGKDCNDGNGKYSVSVDTEQ